MLAFSINIITSCTQHWHVVSIPTRFKPQRDRWCPPTDRSGSGQSYVTYTAV